MTKTKEKPDQHYTPWTRRQELSLAVHMIKYANSARAGCESFAKKYGRTVGAVMSRWMLIKKDIIDAYASSLDEVVVEDTPRSNEFASLPAGYWVAPREADSRRNAEENIAYAGEMYSGSWYLDLHEYRTMISEKEYNVVAGKDVEEFHNAMELITISEDGKVYVRQWSR